MRPDALLLSAVRARRSGPVRRAAMAALSVLLAGLAAGCHVPGTASVPPARNHQVTVAVVPGFATAPVAVGIRDGLFARDHVDVTVQTYTDLQQAYAALTSGQADIISGDYAGLLYMQARAPRAGLRLIADGYDATPGMLAVLTLPGSGITSPQSLQGKAVATPPPGLAPFSADAPYNTETLAAEAVLQSDGVSPSSVQWKPMQPGSMITALSDHAVSAIVTTEPYILQAEAQLGAVELLDACSGVTAGLPLSGYFTTAAFARAHPAAVAGFRAAITEAKGSTAQPGTVQSVLGTLPGMTRQDAALVTTGQYPTFLSIGQIQRVADLMYGTGMISTTISVRGLLLN